MRRGSLTFAVPHGLLTGLLPLLLMPLAGCAVDRWGARRLVLWGLLALGVGAILYLEIWPGTPDSPQARYFLNVDYRCDKGLLKRIVYTRHAVYDCNTSTWRSAKPGQWLSGQTSTAPSLGGVVCVALLRGRWRSRRDHFAGRGGGEQLVRESSGHGHGGLVAAIGHGRVILRIAQVFGGPTDMVGRTGPSRASLR